MKGYLKRIVATMLCAMLLAGGLGAVAEVQIGDGANDGEWMIDTPRIDLETGAPAADGNALQIDLETDVLLSDEVAPKGSGTAALSNDSTGEQDGFTYVLLEDGSASITGCSLEGDVVIPDTIDGYTVTNLKRELFYCNGYVTSVTVPATVTYFGDNPTDSTFTYVFSYCPELKSIKVESGNPSFTSVDGVLYSKDKKILYNYPCNHVGAEYHVPAKTEVLDCTSFACAANLADLYLDSPETIWRTYTFFGDGDLTVHYIKGGYSQTTAEDFIQKGMYREADQDFPTYATYAPEVTGIAIAEGSQAELYMGNKLTLNAKLTPAYAETTLKWSSDDKAVATVKNGVVTPKKAGTARITVETANKLSATITVKVVDAASVKLKKGRTVLKKGATINVKPGESLTLKAVVSPSGVKTRLNWVSSNTRNVTVKNGKVTVKSTARVGTKAKITVRTANNKSTYIYIVVK